jgi:hypothetical protein
MAELLFQAKAIILAIAIVLGLQIRVGEKSIEEKLVELGKSTQIQNRLREVSVGATKALKSTKEKLSGAFDALTGKSTTKPPMDGFAKASRIDFEIQRSPGAAAGSTSRSASKATLGGAAEDSYEDADFAPAEE